MRILFLGDIVGKPGRRAVIESVSHLIASAGVEFVIANCENASSGVGVHAEATSEKVAMGWYLDGRVTAVVGSHTHVQTADERVLPGGTAFLTDAGMCGPRDSVIGVKRSLVIDRFLTQMPNRFEVA